MNGTLEKEAAAADAEVGAGNEGIDAGRTAEEVAPEPLLAEAVRGPLSRVQQELGAAIEALESGKANDALKVTWGTKSPVGNALKALRGLQGFLDKTIPQLDQSASDEVGKDPRALAENVLKECRRVYEQVTDESKLGIWLTRLSTWQSVRLSRARHVVYAALSEFNEALSGLRKILYPAEAALDGPREMARTGAAEALGRSLGPADEEVPGEPLGQGVT